MTYEEAVLKVLSENPYGVTVDHVVYAAGVNKPTATKILKTLVASKKIVSEKVAKNAANYCLPNTCGWSTRVAKMAGIS